MFLVVLFSSIVAILLGLAIWRVVLHRKASKEAKEANQPAPELTWQSFVNGLVLFLGMLLAALGIKWAFNKRSEAKEAAGSGRR
ncbi:hypothetical protein HYW17_00845 [Candidatus Uhrbacteria bacterium]|nr:hypothetical protein [Candidatus Uhrbacteria bacterium]